MYSSGGKPLSLADIQSPSSGNGDSVLRLALWSIVGKGHRLKSGSHGSRGNSNMNLSLFRLKICNRLSPRT